MSQSVQKIAYGASGIVGVEGVNLVMPSDPTSIAEAGGLIIQIIIGIVTLFGLFKKKK